MAQKKQTAAAPRKRIQPPQPAEFEERESSGKMGKVIAAIAFYGIALIMAYLIIIPQEPNTPRAAMHTILYGFGGSLSVLIPVFFGWLATLLAFSAAEKKLSTVVCVTDALLFFCLFTAVQLFYVRPIMDTKMEYMKTFANFVDKSYRYLRGGGAIGALLAWPLYHALGSWGGLLVIFIIVCILLTCSGRTVKIGRALRVWMKKAQAAAEERRKAREEEELLREAEQPPIEEDAYDAYDYAPQAPKNIPQAPKKKTKRAPTLEIDPTVDSVRAPRMETGSDYATPKAGEKTRLPGEKVAPKRKVRAVQESEDPLTDHFPNMQPRKRKPHARVQAHIAEPQSVDPLFDVAEEFTPAPTAIEDIYEPDINAVHAAREKKPIKVDCPPPQTVETPKAAPIPEEDIPPFDIDPVFEEKPAAKVSEPHIEDIPDLTIVPEEHDVFSSAEETAQASALPKLRRQTNPEPVKDEAEEYFYPPIDLLEESVEVSETNRDADLEKAQLLERTLRDFGIDTKLTGIAHGPAVTRFELTPAPGIKVARISSLADDIAMRLAAMSVRIEAPIPGKAAVGVEIPNEKIEMVHLRDVLFSQEARRADSKIAVALGKDNSGRYIVANIAKMPHVLIAGQTGSGKSVCINAIITSILYRATPDEVRMILIDPKVVELSIYNDIPHLVCPVVTDPKKASSALQWAVTEMDSRYRKFADLGVRDIKGYNKALPADQPRMPQMVIIIDELADLMMVAPGEVEESICRLAQLARACGMHLVIATQRPSVNVITGVIKANIPTRIAFSVASQVDSRTMIDRGGAEKLLGNGDMLFVPPGINKAMRVQGAWVSDEEVHAVVNYIKERSATSYDEDMIEQMNNATRSDAEKEEVAGEYDPRLPEAVEIVVEAGQASVSMLQRRMRVGYARAGRMIDEMEQRGIISPGDGSKCRDVLIGREQMQMLFEDE